MSKGQIEGIKRRRGVNPITVVFHERTNPKKWRVIRCFRMDETPDSWAVHTKLFFKGHHYVRHVTEWFQKSIFELDRKGYGRGRDGKEPALPLNVVPKRRGRPPKVRPAVEAPCDSVSAATSPTKSPESITVPSAAPPVSVSKWAEENPALAAMHTGEAPPPPQPKSAPPPIMLVLDDEDDTIPGQVAPTPGPPAAISKVPSINANPGDIKSELPGEYNPLAHPEKVAGEIEDLVIFDEHVSANFLATQSRLKMMKLRAKQQQRIPTRNNPVITMAE